MRGPPGSADVSRIKDTWAQARCGWAAWASPVAGRGVSGTTRPAGQRGLDDFRTLLAGGSAASALRPVSAATSGRSWSGLTGASRGVAAAGGPVPVDAQRGGVVSESAPRRLYDIEGKLANDLTGMPVERRSQDAFDVDPGGLALEVTIGKEQEPVAGDNWSGWAV